jgi:predicted DNA-binding transcriptional regulator YafY
MSGYLANYQTRRDREIVLNRNREEKYIDIQTKEDYLFWFRQRILQYGANVTILEPQWLREEIAQELKQTYLQYATDKPLT